MKNTMTTKWDYANSIIALWKQYEANKDGNANQRQLAKETLGFIVNDCNEAMKTGYGNDDPWFQVQLNRVGDLS